MSHTRLWTGLVLCTLLILGAACSTAVDPTNPYDPSAPADQQAKGQVSGTVKLERAKEYAGALVTLEGTSQTGMTSADGTFKLTGVAAGSYALVVAKDGYRTQRVPAVAVKLGAKTDLGQILVLVARGLVRGQVSLKDAGEAGSGGALVTLKSADPGAAQGVPAVPVQKMLFDPKAETVDAGSGVAAGESFGSISGNDGTWEIGNVPAGQYFLLVSKDGYQTSCMGLVTIVKDGEEKSLGVLELTGASALVRFADSAGLDLEPYKADGVVRYYTNDKGLKAHFTAAGAVRMRVGWSAATVDAAAYEAFAVEKDVALSAGEADGAKTLYVDLRDQCGMERRYTASLTLDTAAPEVVGVEVVADEGLDGKRYVRAADGQVTVRLSGEDKGSGLSGYRLTVDKAPTDEAYVAIPGSWNVVTGLGTEQREYEVYAEYRDRAGNAKTAGPVKVTLDSTAPVAGEPPVVVENGVDVGGKRTVYDDFAALKFAVTGAAQFSLGAASGTGSWQDFAETSRISLAGRARGDVRQYVKFRDQAKNETAEYTVEYVYETQGSVRGKVTLEGSGDPTTVSVLISAAGASAVNPDANGDYAVLGVERGSYTIKLSAAGFEDAQQLVLVNAGKDATVPDAQLKRARGTLKGTFTLAGAQGHAGITVKVSEAGLSLETAQDGSFELKNMVAQQYTVSASKYGYVSINGQAVTVPSGGTGTAAGGALQVALGGQITGTVSCDVGGCVGADVTLTGTRFDGATAADAVKADNAGAYTLGNLAAGDYTVGATKAGYRGATASVTLEPGASKGAGALTLNARRGALAGTATAAMVARAGVQVNLAGTGTIGEAVNATVATDSSGHYRFDGILSGTYTLTATMADYLSGTKQVTVAAETENDGGTLDLAVNPGSVTGKVSLEGGGVPTGVQVVVVAPGVSPVVPDGTGAYAVTGLQAGTYTVRYTLAGYEEGQLVVVVKSGAATALPDVTLKKARGTLKGTFTLAGATGHAGITVRVIEAGLTVETAADGSFEMTGLVAQQYTVSAAKHGYVSISGQTVTVPGGGVGTAAGGALQVDLTASISGTASCDVGACGAATLSLTGTRFDGQSVTQNGTTNGDGTFTLNNLAAGDYAVAATLAGYKGAQAQASVEPGASKQAGVLTMAAQRGSVSGVAQAAGTPASGIQVTVAGTSTIGVAVNATTTSGPGGTFNIAGLLAGTYTLTATLADYNTVTQQVTVAVDADANVGTLNLTVNPGTVTGTLALEGGGDPATAQVVVVAPGVSPVVPAGTGAYTVAGLAAGTYAVRYTAPGYDESQGTAVVKAGAATTMPAVSLKRSRGTLRGVFTLAGAANHAGITVRAIEAGLTVETAADGSFEMPGLVAQQYTVSAAKYGYAAISGQTVTVPAGGVGVAAGGQLQVALTGAIGGLVACDVGACGAATLALTGTRFDGQSVTQNGTTNPGGTFTLNGLAAGDYAVSATLTGYKSAQALASVVPDGTKLVGTILLPAQRGGVSGVAQAAGTPASGIQVTVAGTSTIGVAVNATTTSGPGGTFNIAGLLTGTYTLTATLADYNAVSQQVTVAADAETNVGTLNLTVNPGTVTGVALLEGGGDATAITVTVDGANAVNPNGSGAYSIGGLPAGTRTLTAALTGYYSASTTVVVKAAQSVAATQLTLMRARGKVAGQVMLQGQGSNEGALVVIAKGSVRFATTTTATGDYEIPGVPADSGYELSVTRDGYLSKHVTGVLIEPDKTTTLAMIVLETVTGDFNFMHCAHWSAGDKQLVSLLGQAYVTECPAGSGGPKVRLDLNPPSGTTKLQWALMSDFSDQTEVNWDALNPPQVDLGTSSGTVKVYVKYFVPTNTPQWTDPFSAGVFVDREVPVVDAAVVLNDPAYLTPTRTYMQLSVSAHDPLSNGETGSGVKKYALVVGGGACPADGAAYSLTPADIETGSELSVQVVSNPGLETEGTKTVRVCVRDAAGNLAAWVDKTIVFDKTAPVAGTFGFYLDRTDLTAETLTNMRNVVLKAAVTTDHSPLSGVAYATAGFDCDTATYETPDVVSDTPSGTQHAYVIAKDWVLSGSDGTKKANICLKDAAGNVTGASTETSPAVVLDTSAPATCAVQLKGGAPSTNARDIAVALSSSDPAGQVWLSGDVDAASPLAVNAWLAFSANPVPLLRLSNGDGVKTVTIKCMDAAGNVSAVNFATILLDRVPPSGYVVLADDAGYTQANLVKVTLTGIDDRTGVSSYKLSNDGTAPDCANPAGYTAFAATVNNWPLVDAEGTRTVTACFMDGAGNTAQIGSDTIYLDKTNPAGTLAINGADQYATTLNVTLSFTGVSGDVAQMKVSNASMTCASETGYLAYSPAVTHQLASGADGLRTVYACLKDASGRVNAATISDTITLDTAAPVVTSFGLSGSPMVKVLPLGLAMNVSNATWMKFAGDITAVAGGTVDAWMAYAAAATVTLRDADGPLTVTAQFKDDAGNTTDAYFATATLDRVAPTGTVALADEAAYAQTNLVKVSLTGADDRTGVAKYKLANDGTLPDCANAAGYQNFTGTVNNWPLVDAEGTRTVTLCLMDGAGNTAQVATDTIYLDKTDPVGTLTVNGGDQYTSALTVMLALSGVSADVVQMKVSNAAMTCATETGLTAYSPLQQHQLSSGADGARTVYACLKDASGRVNAATISDGITLDTAAPSVTAYALAGGDYTTTTAATLNMTVTGVTEMRISGDVSAVAGGTPNAWMTYNAPNGVTLSAGDGPKTVTAQFRDAAGNVTTLYSDTVTLDQTKPTGSVTINNNDAKTASLLSTLTVTAAGDTEKMYLSNASIPDCAAVPSGSYTDYVSVKVWPLASGADGARTVYACLKDYAGNASAAAMSDGITVDTTPPGTDATSLSINEGDQTQAPGINLSMHTTDGTTTGYTMYIDGDVEAASGVTYEWVAYGTSTGVTLTASQGLKQVRVRFKDDVGNISAAASDTITYDHAGPEIPSMSINEGDITKASAVNLTLFASSVDKMCVFGDVRYAADPPATYRTVADPSQAGDIGKECFTNNWWETYATSKASGTLRSANASNTVYVIYKDLAGNITTTLISDTIYYDTALPVITGPTVMGVVADSQASTTLTGTPNVTLSWTVTGAGRMSGGVFSGTGTPTEMAFANVALVGDPATVCSSLSYEPYATTKAWTLTVGSSPDGAARYVDFCMKDQAGNYSASVRGTINLDLVAPTVPQFTIMQGEYATGTAITANLNATGATQYWVEGDVTDTASTFEWKSAALPVNGLALTLSGTDGTKVVMARYRDAAGNVSAAAIDTIQLDSGLPAGTVSINNGAAYTNNALATLSTTTSATDIVAMDVKNASTPCSDVSRTYATTFSNQVTYTLPGGEGTKTVYVCYLDRAGNKSAAETTDAIEYDTIAPSITSVTVPTYSLTTAATITNNVTHATAFEMRFYGDITAVSGGAVGAWKAYAASQAVTLSTGDGLKAVTAEFRDSALNTVSALVTTTLDTGKPSGTVSINSGAAYTNNALVTLATATTDLDISAMDIKTTNVACSDGSRAYSTTYSNQVTYPLTGGEALNPIYVCYLDRAGNKSVSTAYDDITLDLTAPAITSVTVPIYSLAATPVTITNNVTHAGAFEMRFYGDITAVSGGTVGAWKAYAASQVVTLSSTTDGLKAITAEFRDSAGNISSALVTTTLDTGKPSGTVSINSGAAYTNNALVTLTTATTDLDIIAMDIKTSNLACSDGSRAYSTTYSNQVTYPLTGGEALNPIYVCYQDRAGNKSVSTAYDDITLDLTAPAITSVTVPAYSLAASATITNNVTHAGAFEMRFYGDITAVSGGAVGAWKVYAASQVVTLNATTDGLKAITAEFRDSAGNISSALVTTTLDTTLPTGTVSINNGAAYTNSRLVTLYLDSTHRDIVSVDIQDIGLTCNNASRTYGTTFSNTVSYPLPAAEVNKTVYVCFKDRAGNISSSYVTDPDGITLDMSAPTNPTVIANGGNAYTKNLSVTLTINGSGTPLSYFVEGDLTGGGDAFQWRTPGSWPATATVGLQPSEGSHVFRVKLRDAAANESDTAMTTIVYDGSMPLPGLMRLAIARDGSSVLTDTLTASRTVDLYPHAEDSVSGVAYMQISRCATFDMSAQGGAAYSCGYATCTDAECCVVQCPYAEFYDNYTLKDTIQEQKWVYARFQNNAWALDAPATWAGTAVDYIYYDTTVPTIGAFTVTTPANGYTKTGLVTLSVSASDTGNSPYDVTQVIFAENPPGYNSYAWEAWTGTDLVAMTRQFHLSPGEGQKTIIAKVRDGAGRESLDGTVTVTLDTQAPTIDTFLPVNGMYVNATNISYAADVWDNISASTSINVCAALGTSYNCGTCGTWVQNQPTLWFNLPFVAGTNTVNLCAVDQAGNLTASPKKTTVIYDVTAPATAPLLGTPVPDSRVLNLSWQAASDGASPPASGIDHYDVYWSPAENLAVNNLAGTTTGLSFTISGLTNYYRYSVYVVAFDKAGNQTMSSRVIGIPGWEAESFDGEWFGDTTTYESIIYHFNRGGSPDTIDLKSCDLRLKNCLIESSWSAFTIVPSSSLGTLQHRVVVGADQLGNSIMYFFYGHTNNDQILLRTCDLSNPCSTDEAYWSAAVAVYTPPTANDYPFNGKFTVSNNGRAMLMAWERAESLNHQVMTSICQPRRGASDCTDPTSWSLVTHEAIADNSNTGGIASVMTDRFPLLAFRGSDGKLNVSRCTDYDTDCDVIGDWTNYTVDASTNYSGNWPAMATDGTRAWIVYTENVTLSDGSDSSLKVAVCTLSSLCDTALDWTIYTLFSDTGLRILWSRPVLDVTAGELRLAFLHRTEFAIKYLGCTLTTGCNSTADWRADGVTGLVKDAAQFQYGSASDLSGAFIGPDPWLMALPVDNAFSGVIGPILPSPRKFVAGPGPGNVILNWQTVGISDGVAEGFTVSRSAPVQQHDLTNPNQKAFEYALAAGTAETVSLSSRRGVANSSPANSFSVASFADIPITTDVLESPLREGMMTAIGGDLDGTRVAAVYQSFTDGNIYVRGCGSSCTTDTNWGVAASLATTDTLRSMSLASARRDSNPMMLAWADRTGLKMMTCEGAANQCKTAADWGTTAKTLSAAPNYIAVGAIDTYYYYGVAACRGTPREYDGASGTVTAVNQFTTGDTAIASVTSDILRLYPCNLPPANEGLYKITGVAAGVLTVTKLDGTAPGLTTGRTCGWEILNQASPFQGGYAGEKNNAVCAGANDFKPGVAVSASWPYTAYLSFMDWTDGQGGTFMITGVDTVNNCVSLTALDGSIPSFTNRTGVQWAVLNQYSYGDLYTFSCRHAGGVGCADGGAAWNKNVQITQMKNTCSGTEIMSSPLVSVGAQYTSGVNTYDQWIIAYATPSGSNVLVNCSLGGAAVGTECNAASDFSSPITLYGAGTLKAGWYSWFTGRLSMAWESGNDSFVTDMDVKYFWGNEPEDYDLVKVRRPGDGYGYAVLGSSAGDKYIIDMDKGFKLMMAHCKYDCHRTDSWNEYEVFYDGHMFPTAVNVGPTAFLSTSGDRMYLMKQWYTGTIGGADFKGSFNVLAGGIMKQSTGP